MSNSEWKCPKCACFATAQKTHHKHLPSYWGLQEYHFLSLPSAVYLEVVTFPFYTSVFLSS